MDRLAIVKNWSAGLSDEDNFTVGGSDSKVSTRNIFSDGSCLGVASMSFPQVIIRGRTGQCHGVVEGGANKEVMTEEDAPVGGQASSSSDSEQSWSEDESGSEREVATFICAKE